MSFPALAWASLSKVARAADKLVLLGLADRHNTEHDLAYPSLAWLCEFSSLDRKTVVTALDRLEVAGFIADSGQRVGKTKQVKAYRLNINQPENGTVKTELFKSKGSDISAEQSQKRDTDTVTEPKTEAKASCDRIVSVWNDRAVKAGFAKVEVLNASRTQRLLARRKEVGEAKMVEAIDNMIGSAFLRGDNDRKRRQNFDFLLQPDKLPRILEGFYGQDAKPAERKPVDWDERARFYDKIGRKDDADDCRRRALPIGQITDNLARIAQ